tara:strand:- start:1103 stop:1936 length:834 start_codon:yes stop_codon:yes gene_type:complete
MKIMLDQSKKISTVDGTLEILKTLKSGPISEISLCKFNGIKSIIRVDFKWAYELKINRKTEFDILNKINFIGLSPEIIYQDLSQGILIWTYIDAKDFRIVDETKLFLLRDLGVSLKKVHSVEVDKNLTNIFNDSIFFYEEILINEPNQNLINKGFNLYKRLCDDDIESVLSHNDLNKSNILFNQRFFFLDWEYASINHPYFDIATISVSFNLNLKDINTLWSGYDKNCSVLDIDKLHEWMTFSYFLDYMWRLSLVKVSDLSSGDLDIVTLERKIANF